MRRSEFAGLIGVSKQQVGKYVAKGYVILEGDLVDVDQSLIQLEGHLDEAKRQRALQIRAMASGARVVADRAEAPRAPVERSAKVQREEIEVALKRLDLAKAAGEVVMVADVDEAARSAVQELRELVSQSNRETADRICAQFGLGPEKAIPLQRFLAAQFELVMGRYAARMATLAAGEVDPAQHGAETTDFDAPATA